MAGGAVPRTGPKVLGRRTLLSSTDPRSTARSRTPSALRRSGEIVLVGATT